MILAIDIGNSDVTAALWKDGSLDYQWRWRSLPDAPPTYYEQLFRDSFLEARLGLDQVEQIVLSAVVPALREKFPQILEGVFGLPTAVMGPELYDKLPLNILRPYEIGTDLVANALSAYLRYPDKNRIVVDFGTALTFTIIEADGTISGVSIAPGLGTAVRALTGNTAQLPDVPLELPESAIGTDTVSAIQAGILHGYIGLVRHMLDAIKSERDEHYIAIATGGLSSILGPLKTEFMDIDILLTLDGIRQVAQFVKA